MRKIIYAMAAMVILSSCATVHKFKPNQQNYSRSIEFSIENMTILGAISKGKVTYTAPAGLDFVLFKMKFTNNSDYDLDVNLKDFHFKKGEEFYGFSMVDNSFLESAKAMFEIDAKNSKYKTFALVYPDGEYPDYIYYRNEKLKLPYVKTPQKK